MQVPKKYTDLDLSLVYILTPGTYSKFAGENNFPAPGVYFPQACSSAGRRFTASRSRLQIYRRIISFSQQKIDEMRCKLDSTENPRSLRNTQPHLKVGLGIWEFCAISRRLISKIRFPHPISVADAICGTCFDLRDSKRRALEN